MERAGLLRGALGEEEGKGKAIVRQPWDTHGVQLSHKQLTGSKYGSSEQHPLEGWSTAGSGMALAIAADADSRAT